MAHHWYTVAVINHGRAGWRWVVMDWGTPLSMGYERSKHAAFVKARADMKRKRNKNELNQLGNPRPVAVSTGQPVCPLELLAGTA